MPTLGPNHLGFDFIQHEDGVTTIVIRPPVECFVSLGPTDMHA